MLIAPPAHQLSTCAQAPAPIEEESCICHTCSYLAPALPLACRQESVAGRLAETSWPSIALCGWAHAAEPVRREASCITLTSCGGICSSRPAAGILASHLLILGLGRLLGLRIGGERTLMHFLRRSRSALTPRGGSSYTLAAQRRALRKRQQAGTHQQAGTSSVAADLLKHPGSDRLPARTCRSPPPWPALRH